MKCPLHKHLWSINYNSVHSLTKQCFCKELSDRLAPYISFCVLSRRTGRVFLGLFLPQTLLPKLCGTHWLVQGHTAGEWWRGPLSSLCCFWGTICCRQSSAVSFLVLLLILPTPVILFSSLRVSWKSALWCTERLNRGVDERDFSACFPGTSPNPPPKSRISPGSSYFRILFHTIPVGDSEEVNTLSLTTWPNLLMKYVPKYLSDGSFLLYSQ